MWPQFRQGIEGIKNQREESFDDVDLLGSEAATEFSRDFEQQYRHRNGMDIRKSTTVANENLQGHR